jgi:hypothetical protein
MKGKIKAHGDLPWMVYYGCMQIYRKFVILRILGGYYSDLGTIQGVLQGGTTRPRSLRALPDAPSGKGLRVQHKG